MLPGIAPTGRAVEIATVAVVQFQDHKLVHEHVYRDQASVLVQLGLLDPDGLPIARGETARKVLDVSLPSNTLMTPPRSGVRQEIRGRDESIASCILRRVAKTSASSLSATPECPFTENHSTLWSAQANLEPLPEIDILDRLLGRCLPALPHSQPRPTW